jgi:hypothetical protein
MGDITADAGKGLEESFHLVEHAIDDHRKFGEGIICVPMLESFAQVAGDEALNALIDLDDTSAARALSTTPTAMQRSIAGTRPSASARPTT